MYLPFGGTRWESGATPTDFQFTGQRKEAGFGLYDYNARYYDPLLGRFVSADAVVPGAGNPQALNRYTYSYNNPLRYVDPSGHGPEDYYIFVQGCVALSGGGDPCNNPPQEDWYLYLDFLRNSLGFGEMKEKQFYEWANTHVKFVRARNSDPTGIAEAVNGLNPGGGSIFLIGHSAGASAVMNYLRSLKENPTASMPRIGGAFAIDAPLAGEPIQSYAAKEAGFQRASFEYRNGRVVKVTDNLQGLGAWAKDKGLALLTISYADDWLVNPLRQVTDIPHQTFETNPYYQVGPFDFGLKHAYLLSDPNGASGVLNYLYGAGLLR
jgi:RHS repeat-associated protein